MMPTPRSVRDRQIAAPLKRLIQQPSPGDLWQSVRDRQIAAPLKHHEALWGDEQSESVRDRQIAAPLKPRSACGFIRDDDEPVRDRQIAAPLKRQAPASCSQKSCSCPRPSDRGPIEARPFLVRLNARTNCPRPSDRGPIEATLSGPQPAADRHLSATVRSRPH